MNFVYAHLSHFLVEALSFLLESGQSYLYLSWLVLLNLYLAQHFSETSFRSVILLEMTANQDLSYNIALQQYCVNLLRIQCLQMTTKWLCGVLVINFS